MSQVSFSQLPKKRGRPPSQASRQAILDAAAYILTNEGLGRLTIERVAARAGVGKPTIYRSWLNAQELAMAALMVQTAAQTTVPPTDPTDAVKPTSKAKSRVRAVPIRERCTTHLQGVIAALATHRGRQITLTLASADPESELGKAFRNQVILKSREEGRALLTHAMQTGDIRTEIELDTVLDMLYGPLFFRVLVGHGVLDAGFANQLVATVFDGIRIDGWPDEKRVSCW